MFDVIHADLPELKRLHQYAGIWAIESRAGQQFFTVAKGLLEDPARMSTHVAQAEEQATQAAAGTSSGKPFQLYNNNVAVISIEGTMTKYGSSLSASGSTLRAQKQLRAAMKDSDITGILMHMETPGGTVTGVHELASDVREAGKSKHVWTYAEDLCCSAGYWVGSQAHKMYANEMATIGSIGVYMVVNDLSKMAEQEGLTVHVIRNGAFKGAGTPGTEITDEQLAEWQRSVDAIAEKFHGAVKTARGLSAAELKELADGRVHMAPAAQQLKLIDGIKTLDKVLADLSKQRPVGASASVPEQLGETMSQTETPAAGTATPAAPAAASFEQIVAVCKGFNASSAEDAMFAVDCQSKKLTAEQARDAWMETLNARTTAARQEAADASKKTNQTRSGGTTTLNDGDGKASGTSAGDSIAAWEAAVDETMKAKRCSKAKAISILAAEEPQLHEAYVKEWNATRDRRPKGRSF